MTLSTDIAQAILDGFDKHYRLFRETSARAKERFERGGLGSACARRSATRIDMYDQRVAEARRGGDARAFPTPAATRRSGAASRSSTSRCSTRSSTSSPSAPRRSSTRSRGACSTGATTTTSSSSGARPCRPSTSTATSPPTAATTPRATDLTDTFRDGRSRASSCSNEFQDLERDLAFVRRAIGEHFPEGWSRHRNFQVQVLALALLPQQGRLPRSGASSTARARCRSSCRSSRTTPGSSTSTRILLDAKNIGRVFSLGRAYFMVDMEVPSAYVEFLASIAPTKPKAELYTLVGLQKQGKTLFFRDLQQHLRHSSDTFVLAPGTKGMVMLVFTLAVVPVRLQGHPRLVRAAEGHRPARSSRSKYDFVKQHDRVGRMADTLEFAARRLPDATASTRRCSPSCRSSRPRSSRWSRRPDQVVIQHLYIERRLVPLDLYLEHADDEHARAGDRPSTATPSASSPARTSSRAICCSRTSASRATGASSSTTTTSSASSPSAASAACPRPRDDDDEMAERPLVLRREERHLPRAVPDVPLPAGQACARRSWSSTASWPTPGYWIAQQERVKAGIQDDLFPYDAGDSLLEALLVTARACV